MSYRFKQEISRDIFFTKYALHGEKSVEDVLLGVAEEVAGIEREAGRWKDVFFAMMRDGYFIPGGRILANARPGGLLKNYNNCFTIGVEDSIEGIYNSLKEDALISKMGGGVGINFSKLRPLGDGLSKGGEASGVVSFMKVFDASAKVIHTGGSRRSAHIGLLSIGHPDVEEFIRAKQGDINKELTQFNISVVVPDSFMEAVEKDGDWNLGFGGKTYKSVKARDLFDRLAEHAFTHNEPGLFFIDTVNRFNNGYKDFSIDVVNPCGEIVMPPYSLCCLGALNLTSFVRDPFKKNAGFDFEKMGEIIGHSVRFLDNVLDVTDYPLEKIETMSKKWRRIGLGFTGLADVFVMMGLTYGDEGSRRLSHRIGSCLRDSSYMASANLAEEKGSFPNFAWDRVKDGAFMSALPEEVRKLIAAKGLRNINLNTCAPTGTISLTLGDNCSSGIEPIFSLEYRRRVRSADMEGFHEESVEDYAYLLYKEVTGNGAKNVKRHESDRVSAQPSGELPPYFVTTFDIDPDKGVEIQAIFQEYIDQSISKTANLPENYGFEEYKKLLFKAWKQGLKGFTSFNPKGSMEGILKKSGGNRDEAKRKRPSELRCDIHSVKIEKDSYTVLIGTFDDGMPYEVFAGKSDLNLPAGQGVIHKMKKGRYDLILNGGGRETVITDIVKSFANKDYATLTRFVSMGLRHEVDIQFIVEQLQKDEGNIYSFEKVIARVLKQYIKDGEAKASHICSQCGGRNMAYVEGCLTCKDCGYSKCN